MRPKLVYGLIFGFLVTALCIVVLVASFIKTKKSPGVNNAYKITGIINIPYAGIVEPFKAWYTAEYKMSRIDYYNGMVKNYYLGNDGAYGSGFEIVPVTTENYLNQITCFRQNGTASAPVVPQNIIPDISTFKYVGPEVLNGYDCEVWREEVKSFERISTYTIWIRWEKNPNNSSLYEPVPLKYEMMGYDTLLGSHYDHYFINYDIVTLEKPDNEIFKLPANLSCGGMSNLSNPHSHNPNPMKELIHRDSEHVDKAWEHFKIEHSKSYDEKQHNQRKNNFRHNLRFIQSTNRQGLGYNLNINHLADLNNEELRQKRGRLLKQGYDGGDPFPYSSKEIDQLETQIPKEFDWRTHGAVTPVKDQAICGACWSFGTTGSLEGAYFIKTGHLTNFSEQAIVDCSWGEGNRGCDGGLVNLAFQWMINRGGVPSSNDYGHYLGEDGYCHLNNITMMARLKSYVNVTSGNVKALKLAIFKHGPVAVAIDASHNSFSFYSKGLYYEKKCSSKFDHLDHTVLAIGYGTLLDGQNYWLIKNQWSSHWGAQGYSLMASNNCGVETAPNYPVLA